MQYAKILPFLIVCLVAGNALGVGDENAPLGEQYDPGGYDATAVDACTDAGISSGLEGAELENYVQDCLEQYYPRQQDIPYDQG
jgi:hypothetical protein